MTKCVKCGGDITEGAKFCSYCGTPVESGTTKDETKERTQVFVGTIRKCPNCGEQIGTNATKCPACGFVIEKRNVSASLDDFVKKLASFDHYAKKREYIENYPVPNNKEDIRDLLTYAASQRDKDYDDNVAKAYWVDAWNNKCRQIVNQAFDTFGMDEDFASWLRNYKAGVEKSSAENEKLKKKLRSIEKGKKRAAGAKKFFKAFGIIVVILAVLGGAGFGIKSYLNSETYKTSQEKKLELKHQKAEQAHKEAMAKLEVEKVAASKQSRENLYKPLVFKKEEVHLGGFLSEVFEVSEGSNVQLLPLRNLGGGTYEATYKTTIYLKAIADYDDVIKNRVMPLSSEWLKEKKMVYNGYGSFSVGLGEAAATNFGEIRSLDKWKVENAIENARKGDSVTLSFETEQLIYGNKKQAEEFVLGKYETHNLDLKFSGSVRVCGKYMNGKTDSDGRTGDSLYIEIN